MRAENRKHVLLDGVPAFDSNLVPWLHVGPDAFEDVVALHELRRVLAFDEHRARERLVGADIDVLLVVGVDEGTGRDVTVDNVLDLSDRVEL